MLYSGGFSMYRIMKCSLCCDVFMPVLDSYCEMFTTTREVNSAL